MAKSLQNIAKSLHTIAEGQLYFIELASEVYEGEMRVGLARAQESCEEEGGEKEIKVRWYARREWLRQMEHVWKCPSFEYARNPTNARSTRYTTMEKLAHFLPLLPQLTAKCSDEHPRISKKM